MSKDKLEHYKRECLILSLALHDACMFATVNDRERGEALMDIFINNNRIYLNSLNPCCFDEMLGIRAHTP